MMKLKEWNESLKYADKVAERFKGSGLDVRVKPYTMYDGRKGLHLQLFDIAGHFYKEYPSGIHENFHDMKAALETFRDDMEPEMFQCHPCFFYTAIYTMKIRYRFPKTEYGCGCVKTLAHDDYFGYNSTCEDQNNILLLRWK